MRAAFQGLLVCVMLAAAPAMAAQSTVVTEEIMVPTADTGYFPVCA